MLSAAVASHLPLRLEDVCSGDHSETSGPSVQLCQLQVRRNLERVIFLCAQVCSFLDWLGTQHLRVLSRRLLWRGERGLLGDYGSGVFVEAELINHVSY